MRFLTLAAVSAATLSLAACGGSSVDGDMSDVDLPPQYDSLEGLVSAAEKDELETASESQMSGTATMTGALAIGDIGEDEDLEALGDLSLTANFTSGTVSGTADNFALYNEDTLEVDTDLTGSLSINGTISGTSLTADADGILNDGEDHTLDLAMSGTFYDYEGDLAVYGDVSGNIDGEYHEGGFAAVED
ncbi:hypothetical protein [Celeribacter persicus]|uniref:Transferrin-binding protein B C-lobe/N-lobe beta barrel domain-containing protein n=1 Tax=Celeribacter persicus TaxID=1651082 RepID=A0A2T5HJY8_9RHOB|nr:hypothetical protein [Celeribacter persicus]PTQ71884.1 hypothetical protein C8N42_10763 [Celeribacter persicus]